MTPHIPSIRKMQHWFFIGLSQVSLCALVEAVEAVLEVENPPVHVVLVVAGVLGAGAAWLLLAVADPSDSLVVCKSCRLRYIHRVVS